MDILFLLGQVLFLAALAWGAALCLYWHDEDGAEAPHADGGRLGRHSTSRS